MSKFGQFGTKFRSIWGPFCRFWAQMGSDLDPWGSVVILHVVMGANEQKVAILVAPELVPKWTQIERNESKSVYKMIFEKR